MLKCTGLLISIPYLPCVFSIHKTKGGSHITTIILKK